MLNEENPALLLIGGIVVFIVLATIGGAFFGEHTQTDPILTPDRSSSEYRYVENRMKLEGMSSSESRQAADAVLKFHAAQKARQR